MDADERQRRIAAQHQAFTRLWKETYAARARNIFFCHLCARRAIKCLLGYPLCGACLAQHEHPALPGQSLGRLSAGDVIKALQAGAVRAATAADILEQLARRV